jgi:hypothetical protein
MGFSKRRATFCQPSGLHFGPNMPSKQHLLSFYASDSLFEKLSTCTPRRKASELISSTSRDLTGSHLSLVLRLYPTLSIPSCVVPFRLYPLTKISRRKLEESLKYPSPIPDHAIYFADKWWECEEQLCPS